MGQQAARGVALVTGASKGLGRALSLELAARGSRVVMVARGRAELERAAAFVRESSGGPPPIPLAFDVGDKAAVYPLAQIAAELAGEIDVLVHNASDLGPVPMVPLLDLACEDFQRVLDTNLLGPFRLTKAVAGSMALRRRGTVVFLSSDAAVNAYETWGAYGASKAAADHLARIFAAELAIHGVRSFAVDPTDMDTDMHRAALPDADPSTLARPEVIARRIARMIESSERAPTGTRQVASEEALS